MFCNRELVVRSSPICARDSQKAIFLEESLEKVTFCHFEETGNLILVETS